jgi:hypothetical protein
MAHYAVWIDEEGVHLVNGETNNAANELPDAVGGSVLLAEGADPLACLTEAIDQMLQATAALERTRDTWKERL